MESESGITKEPAAKRVVTFIEWQRAVARYEDLGYYVVQKSDEMVMLQRDSLFNGWIFIVLLLLSFICAIIYLVIALPKTYRVTLQQSRSGGLEEMGDTVERFKEKRQNLTTVTWVLFAISLCMLIYALVSLVGNIL